jgi:beta-glucosidase
MQKILSFMTLAACLLMLASCGGNDGTVYNANGDPQLNPNNIERVIKAMTDTEKVELLIGNGMKGLEALDSTQKAPVVGQTLDIVPGAAGTTHAIPRLGIPSLVLTDGPAGVRISPTRPGTDSTFYATAFPIGTLLSSSWDVNLVDSVGKAMGNEVLEYGCDVLLGPGMDIHRNPLCGRNFEYYSEDPLLNGKIAAAMVKGVQSNGVGVSAKHFACNDQETHRMGNDARVSQRALREIYLKGFETVVKEADPWTLMSSYNAINGTLACESKELLTTITRDEWGFKGLVMTDWLAGKDAAKSIAAGNDLLEPGLGRQKEQLLQALKDSTLKEEELNACVRRMLQLIVKSPSFKGYKHSNAPDLKAHAAVTRAAAAEGAILLKNDGNALPLAPEIKNIAAFGTASYGLISGGTGSGDVNEEHTVSLLEGLQNAGYGIDPKLSALYMAYISKAEAARLAMLAKMNNPMAALMLPHGSPADFVPNALTVAEAVKNNDVAVITIGRNSGEGSDRGLEGDFLLTDAEKAMIKTVTAAFHAAGKKSVVVLNIGGVIETASWKDIPDAILLPWQGGEEAGNSIADLLKGTVNPSGKLPMTFPVAYTDVESSKNFPAGVKMTSIADFMGGAPKKPGEALTPNVDYTNYDEGIWVGYRCFDHFNRPVSYPFGYGLSYTTFEYSNASIKPEGNGFAVTVEVKNTGSAAGKEVVELYVSAPSNATLEKPVKELRAFAKTNLLKPGESQAVTLSFNASELASFDEKQSAWTVDAGKYNAIVAASAADIKATLPFEVRKALSTKVNDVLKRQQ